MDYNEIYKLLRNTKDDNDQISWTRAQVELLLKNIILFKNPNFSQANCIIIVVNKFDENNVGYSLRKTPSQLLHELDQVLILQSDHLAENTDWSESDKLVYVWKDRWDFDNSLWDKTVSITNYTSLTHA